ncbi:polymorphic toxin-type HINT domain-containing protein [Streptomyces rubrolavendulae]|uniref:polymorphic toxin-type HINT domain-containing protein n=1 Tax=Streptomyces rubrolavendulae TaxID=285473 RepID=UPI00085A5189|nr:polymorphic toxin-type HINT domain-containing protein [Streptomyces rubrolavendulae]
MPWNIKKGYALGKRIVGLVGELIDGVKGYFEAGKAVDRARGVLAKAQDKLAAARKKAAQLRLKTGCHSFLPGTLVLLEDGTTKPIEEVELGDKLKVTDPETGETTVREVAGTIVTEDDKHFVDLTIEGGTGRPEALISTTTHPFWVESENRWIEAGDLKPGMELRTADGDVTPVKFVRPFDKRQRTHDLTLTDIHTYYVLAEATPVLVHNCDTADPHSLKPTHEIEGNASTKKVKAYHDDMRRGDFDWGQSLISVVTHEDGTQYVVDGHHRLAAARMANVNVVGIRDVTAQLNDGGFLGYKNMDDVVESASTFLGNRLNRRKL